ncbi:hypothetical protein GF339_04250 [candidate division KSB3 bacterium]|uniref:Arylamine N-acetyltransferase n=1 Tax=candidate division KSB3 bacterium TaxID=2044937 RepID=A0A9D5JU81_9BACT|nr:hypothetical protein [candidate division KSB3 bacterium]MBD3323771.1 hypothetical protein [candidate division KSB3 bacterium]
MLTQPNNHPDPHLTIQDQALLHRLLHRAGIDLSRDRDNPLIAKLCALFSQMPYENLTKIIKSETVISAGSAKRLPDELIRDYLHYGTGGTCFSLTAALVAIFNAVGIDAHPILADRHYGPDTHCALVFVQDTELFLLDPGFLIHQPAPLPTTTPGIFSSGVTTIELAPHDAGQKVELSTIFKANKRLRLTYKVSPVDGQTFGRAWERSFAWEMMTYPVLTRCSSGVHHYLQGNVLRIRQPERTTKQVLAPEEQYAYIRHTLGIDTQIITHAFSVITHGTVPSSSPV